MVAVMMTAARFKIHWLRRDRVYVVVNESGVEVARVDEITDAWEIAETLERDHRRRVAARQAAAETAARARAMRSRSAFGLRG